MLTPSDCAREESADVDSANAGSQEKGPFREATMAGGAGRAAVAVGGEAAEAAATVAAGPHQTCETAWGPADLALPSLKQTPAALSMQWM